MSLEHTWPAWGLDEAGRGPILGPMTLALVSLDRRAATKLRGLGVQDSKRFGAGPKAQELRASLSVEIRRLARVCVCVEIHVDVIDEHTYRGQLNVLEQNTALRLLAEAGTPEDAHIIADGCRIFTPLQRSYPRLCAVDKGESAHVAVAAASIVAKHARDEAFSAIAARYAADFGPIAGGGYLNKATRRFLDAYNKVHARLPPEARKSWGAEKVDAGDQLSLMAD
ncbi:hypothetical protein OV090_23300 [Nannocystis sp. RBIL2]|uniref:hypothetical protein n=1 Tax=Nannocystis sp. RBIL2 TaxID=2996788 RepID=UPI00226F1CFA|nr:hypothetical protein [Nannocystis sp. RBIL2]MCY1067694.1 hypothetical protein [Nannocystis sp. RBIL2]